MPSASKVNASGSHAQAVGRSLRADTIYTNEFFKGVHGSAWKGASHIVPKVLELIRPASVIDVGCGTGDFLAAFLENGINDILGIDGDYLQRDLLTIPQENFKPFNLNAPFVLDRTYDLVVCLEVAEHLAPQSAGDFIASLTRLASIVLFSAAIPYQGGIGHINERWPEYWAKLFKLHGFVPVDALRQDIWHNQEIPHWYRQNTLFFCTQEALSHNEKLSDAYKATNPNRLSLIHPDTYLECKSKYLRRLRHILPYLEPLWLMSKR